jgi:hypothetical protein
MYELSLPEQSVALNRGDVGVCVFFCKDGGFSKDGRIAQYIPPLAKALALFA